MLTHRSASRSCPNTANGRQEVEADLECGAAASQLWNGGLGSTDYAVRGMTGNGAFRSLPRVAAKVRCLNRQRTLSVGRGNWSSCPHSRPQWWAFNGSASPDASI